MPFETAPGKASTNPSGQNSNSAAGCQGTKFSNSMQTDMLFAGSGQNVCTPNAAAFNVYNNTNTVVTFNNIPFAPGGFACYDELNDGCYNTPIYYAFQNPAHTGNFIVNKLIKTPR